MNTARKGNSAERKTGAWLSAHGWLIGSRRHIGGAGDWLAVKAGEWPRLIEVKSTARSPWLHFGPDARAELAREAGRVRAVPQLAWWPRGAREPEFLGRDRWPS